MKILFLAQYPAGESPSQRYRFEHYLGYLSGQGIQYNYQPFFDISSWKIFFKKGFIGRKVAGVVKGLVKRWLLMFTVYRYDYVYIHRESAPIGPPVFEWIIAKLFRKKIIYDFDDAIWIPVISDNNKIGRYIKCFWKVKTICRWSHHITTGNGFLRDYALQYNKSVSVIPTVVDTINKHNQLQIQNTSSPVIGWTGSFSTLKFLDIVLPVLRSLQRQYSFRFVVIADVDPKLPLENYSFIKWDKHTETEDLLKMHIGLMPLYDNDLAKGKCGFKAIQYMALGIPAVLSPVGVNATIVDEGENGFLCSSNEEWEERLALLLGDATLRERMGKNARDKIVRKYSVEATKNDFIKLFQ